MLTFNHFNFNVADLDKSLAFYKEALGPVGGGAEGGGRRQLHHRLPGGWKDGLPPEPTWSDHPQKYDLGECEFHLALRAEDYEAAHAKHAAMGCICFENPAMGIYFVTDPDGYWIEIIPTR
ncbi:MAG: VOC family protein [Dysosmobacter welbionis]